jgi:tetratricopeptide (TPR) repeat protein
MKQDAFVEGTMGVFGRLEENPRPWIYGAIAIVAVCLGGFAIWQIVAARSESRAEQLALGQAALLAPVVAEESPKPDDRFQPSFATLEARGETAAQRLAEVSGGTQGKVAELLRGAALLEAGKVDEAVGALEEAADRLEGDPTLAGPSKAALASAYLHAERFEDAVAIWQELSGDENESYPQDLALGGLARTQEAQGNLKEAKSSWQTLLDLYPNSPLAAEARRATKRLEVTAG